jgi:hypothetical protein
VPKSEFQTDASRSWRLLGALFLSALGPVLFGASPLSAQSLDCSKARTAAELASCAPLPAAAPLPPEAPSPLAILSRSTVRASGEDEAMLEVQSAGRVSVRAASKTGVAIQVVDMIAGPGEVAGDGGSRDGRLDLLLDKGTYKLRSFGAKEAQGEAALTVEPFRAAAPADAGLLRGGSLSTQLADLQSRSYWVLVDDAQKTSV